MPAAAYKIRIKIENRLLHRQFEEIVTKLPEFTIQDDPMCQDKHKRINIYNISL